ncbi:hypothetical protein GCM10025868_06870 [Angustibacter aerolatus]|uniref:Uncharacterized protein n=1 Tax=Angustibacter aerolatus TaxID=1162965 RepID=A0ABQ6JB86_9ACTN|nr:hypothetical protein GCM10025868_06870 [Angustibacter aerolatus]
MAAGAPPTRCRAGSTPRPSCSLLTAAGLAPRDLHGVRLFSDLVPEALVDGEEVRSALLALERAVGAHPDHPGLAALATRLHVRAHRP